MTVARLIEQMNLEVISEADAAKKEIKHVFCCDLLSIAMGKAPQNSAWVTVMGNPNTLAVAALTDAACVILAEGIELDSMTASKARDEGITVLSSKQPVFETARSVYELMLEK